MADRTANRNFPIRIELAEQKVLDPTVGSYTQYFVTANGFVIASFVDPASRDSYCKGLRENGVQHFPQRIIDILRYGYDGTPVNLNKPNDPKTNG